MAWAEARSGGSGSSPAAGVAAVILAAGSSSRMAPRNKLLLTDPAGETMVARVADAVLASRICGVWVVVGHQAESVAVALGSRSVTLVHAPDHASGLAFSLARGIAALPADVQAALICLGDMPDISSSVIDRIIAAYQPDSDRHIVVPVHLGHRGNPVLWGRRYFPDILTLAGDRGARVLFDQYKAQICEIEVGSPSILKDVDTVETAGDWR